jgi:chromate reductase
MTTPLHIVGFSGSLRKASYNSGLLRAVAEVLPENVTFEIIDLTPIPLFNPDHEADTPGAVREARESIRAADALLIATPEYNYSFPGVLKNAIDWFSRPTGQSPLIGKPGAIMGAGGRFGTVRAQLQLRQILVHLNVLLLNRPELMIPMAHEKFDTTGNLTDEATRKQLSDLVAALALWTRRLQS